MEQRPSTNPRIRQVYRQEAFTPGDSNVRKSSAKTGLVLYAEYVDIVFDIALYIWCMRMYLLYIHTHICRFNFIQTR